MSKYHYIITAKKRLREENEKNGTKKITIKEVTNINENGKETYEFCSIKKGKSDVVFNCLMWCAVFSFILLVILMIIGKDVIGLKDNFYSLASDFVAAAGLIAVVYSFSKPREFIGKIIFGFGKMGNKLYVSFITFFLALIIAIILSTIDITDKFSNLISFLCVIIALKNLQ